MMQPMMQPMIKWIVADDETDIQTMHLNKTY
jgi:hypothetical protein